MSSKSRFEKQSHVLWHCQYHLIWCPKYRFKILQGLVKSEIEQCVRLNIDKLGGKIVELNTQFDHAHLLVKLPPKLSVSTVMGTLKGKSAIRVFNKFPNLKKKPYWGNHFWAEGYCVDTLGVDCEMIRKYVKYQDKKDKRKDDGQPKLF